MNSEVFVMIAIALILQPQKSKTQPQECTQVKGLCCIEFNLNTLCCPNPLVPNEKEQCCEPKTGQCCPLANIRLKPVPQCCMDGGSDHCCPVTMTPEEDSKCCISAASTDQSNGTKRCCTLPELPSGSCCMLQGIPPDVADLDEPQFALIPQNYMPSMTKNVTIHSDFLKCEHKPIIRNTFGNLVLKMEAHSVPIHWADFLSVRKTVRPKVLIKSLIEDFWPEVIVPFLFPLMIVVMAGLSIIPFMLIGGFGWALLFNLRFLAHKKIRMLIRAYLIRAERFRRWKYERSFPLQHLRKFRERDRYQMPKAFQDSDLSSDDEPEELKREQIPRQKVTMWTDSEIKLIGFDPDNIPMDWVYGDLLGNPDALRPEVKEYLELKRRPARDADFDRASLNSDEWADFLRNRITEKMQREKEMFLTSLHDKLKGMPMSRKGSAASNASSADAAGDQEDRRK